MHIKCDDVTIGDVWYYTFAHQCLKCSVKLCKRTPLKLQRHPTLSIITPPLGPVWIRSHTHVYVHLTYWCVYVHLTYWCACVHLTYWCAYVHLTYWCAFTHNIGTSICRRFCSPNGVHVMTWTPFNHTSTYIIGWGVTAYTYVPTVFYGI